MSRRPQFHPLLPPLMFVIIALAIFNYTHIITSAH